MYVKDKMSKELQVAFAKMTISEVLELIKDSDLHRLPVVDSKNNLIGLITKGSIKRDTKSSTLSVFELNYLFNSLKVEDVMIKGEDLHTISPDALLEEAASILREYKVGCLPVVDNGNKVVGIITQNDIFDAFIDILGYHKDGTRYVIEIAEDKPGVLNAISKCFLDINVSISNLAVYNTERGIELVAIAVGEGSDNCDDILAKNGYKVTSKIRLQNKEA
ncbi:MAG: CBS domain-containing protein [Erysipelotrichaceae bacterium]|nr:CBS domain-containing protein [Erysipelotrichaceae bacterium]